MTYISVILLCTERLVLRIYILFTCLPSPITLIAESGKKKENYRLPVCYTCSTSAHNIQNLLGFEPDCPDIFTFKFIAATVVAVV